MMPLALIWLDAFKSLTNQKLRTSLSAGAVSLAVVAFLLLVNLQHAADYQAEQALAKIGPNTMHVWVHAKTRHISTAKAQALMQANHQLKIYPYRLQMKAVGKHYIPLLACPLELLHHLGARASEGIELVAVANPNAARVGAHVKSPGVFTTMFIGSRGYQVVTKLEAIPSNPLLNFEPDQSVFVSLDKAEQPIEEFLIVYPNHLSKAQAKATFEAWLRDNIGPFEYHYRDDQFIITAVKQSVHSLQVLFQWMAGVALALGMLGVISQQWMSFLQRRGECGMRLSMGAYKSDIVKLFLVESALIGGVGLVLGAGLGVLALKALLSHLGWPFSFWFWASAKIGVGSMVLAVVSGSVPALIAASSPPTRLLAHQ